MKEGNSLKENADNPAGVDETSKEAVIPSSQNDTIPTLMCDNLKAVDIDADADAADGIRKQDDDDNLSFGSFGSFSEASSVTATSLQIVKELQEETQADSSNVQDGDSGAQETGDDVAPPSFGQDETGNYVEVEEIDDDALMALEQTPYSQVEEISAIAQTKDEDEDMGIVPDDDFDGFHVLPLEEKSIDYSSRSDEALQAVEESKAPIEKEREDEGSLVSQVENDNVFGSLKDVTEGEPTNDVLATESEFPLQLAQSEPIQSQKENIQAASFEAFSVGEEVPAKQEDLLNANHEGLSGNESFESNGIEGVSGENCLSDARKLPEPHTGMSAEEHSLDDENKDTLREEMKDGFTTESDNIIQTVNNGEEDSYKKIAEPGPKENLASEQITALKSENICDLNTKVNIDIDDHGDEGFIEEGPLKQDSAVIASNGTEVITDTADEISQTSDASIEALRDVEGASGGTEANVSNEGSETIEITKIQIRDIDENKRILHDLVQPISSFAGNVNEVNGDAFHGQSSGVVNKEFGAMIVGGAQVIDKSEDNFATNALAKTLISVEKAADEVTQQLSETDDADDGYEEALDNVMTLEQSAVVIEDSKAIIADKGQCEEKKKDCSSIEMMNAEVSRDECEFSLLQPISSNAEHRNDTNVIEVDEVVVFDEHSETVVRNGTQVKESEAIEKTGRNDWNDGNEEALDNCVASKELLIRDEESDSVPKDEGQVEEMKEKDTQSAVIDMTNADNEHSFDDFAGFKEAPSTEEVTNGYAMSKGSQAKEGDSDSTLKDEGQIEEMKEKDTQSIAIDMASSVNVNGEKAGDGDEDSFDDFAGFEEAPTTEVDYNAATTGENESEERDDESEANGMASSSIEHEESLDNFAGFEEAQAEVGCSDATAADEDKVKEKDEESGAIEIESSGDGCDFGDFEEIEESTPLEEVSENNDSVFVQKATILLNNLFQDAASPSKVTDKESSICTVHIRDILPTLICDVSDTVSLQEARHSHLQNLFDHTTKKDNLSNVFVDERCQLLRQECTDVDEGYTVGKGIEGNALYDVVYVDLPTLDQVNYAEVDTLTNEEAAAENPTHYVQGEDSTSVPNKSFALEFGEFHDSTDAEKKDDAPDEPHVNLGPTVVKIPKKRIKLDRDAKSSDPAIRNNATEENDGANDNGDIFSAFDKEFQTIGVGVNEDNVSVEMCNSVSPPIPECITNNDGSSTGNHSNNEFISQDENVVKDPFGSAVLTATPVEHVSDFFSAVENGNENGNYIDASDDSFCSFQDIDEPAKDEQNPDLEHVFDENPKENTGTFDIDVDPEEGGDSTGVTVTAQVMGSKTRNIDSMSAHDDIDGEGSQSSASVVQSSDFISDPFEKGIISTSSFGQTLSVSKHHTEEEQGSAMASAIYNLYDPSDKKDGDEGNPGPYSSSIGVSHPEPQALEDPNQPSDKFDNIVNTSDDFGDFKAPETFGDATLMDIPSIDFTCEAEHTDSDSFGQTPMNLQEPGIEAFPMPSSAPPSIPYQEDLSDSEPQASAEDSQPNDDFRDFEAPAAFYDATLMGSPSIKACVPVNHSDTAKLNSNLVPDVCDQSPANSQVPAVAVFPSYNVGIGLQDSNIVVGSATVKMLNGSGSNGGSSDEAAAGSNTYDFHQPPMQPIAQPLTSTTDDAPIQQNVDPFAYLSSLSSPPMLENSVTTQNNTAMLQCLTRPLTMNTSPNDPTPSSIATNDTPASTMIPIKQAQSCPQNQAGSIINSFSDDDSDFGDFCAPTNDLAQQLPGNSSTTHRSSSGNAITDAFSVFD